MPSPEPTTPHGESRRRRFPTGAAGWAAAGLALAGAVPAAVFRPIDPVVPLEAEPAAVTVAAGPGGTTLEHDFGVVRPDRELEHRFTVRNPSDQTRHVTAVRAGCRCTLATLMAAEIPPGGSVPVDVTYTAGGRVGDERKVVRVEFAGADVPDVDLVVTARIRQAFTVRPNEVVLPWSADAGGSSAVAYVANFSDADWRILEVGELPDWLHADLVPLPPADGGGRQRWRLALRADTAGLPGGWQSTTVSLRAASAAAALDLPDLHAILPVRLKVPDPLRVVPPSLFLGDVDAGGAVEGSLRIRPGPGVDPDDVTLRHDMGAIPALRREGERIAVRLTPGPTDRILSGAITVTAGPHEVVVPVRALVRPAADGAAPGGDIDEPDGGTR